MNLNKILLRNWNHSMEELSPIFFILLPVVAFMYASVGHGGASGYLALMALFGVSTYLMRPTALMLNVLVSLIAFIQFYRLKIMKWDLFMLLALTSIPAAYIGGQISTHPSLYKNILGLLLLIPAIQFAIPKKDNEQRAAKINIPLAMFLGGVIGFLSGLIGIGGGIILTPVLLMLRWTNIKQTAVISALFIAVNSIAGLAGIIQKGMVWDNNYWFLILLAFGGGMLGAWSGAFRMHNKWLKRILSIVLIIASLKLIMAK